MKENLTIRVLNGEKIYPYMNGKIIRVSYQYNLKDCYKEILNKENINKTLKENKYDEITNFKDFNKLLLEDSKFLDIIKEYFDKDRILISDKDGEYVFGIKLIDEEDHDYNLRLIEVYGNLNRNIFFEDYTDIFGNEITFK